MLLAPSRRGEVEVAEWAMANRGASEALAVRGGAAPDVPEVSGEPPPEAKPVPEVERPAAESRLTRAEPGWALNWADLGPEGEGPGSAEKEPWREPVPLEGPGRASAGPAVPEGWKEPPVTPERLAGPPETPAEVSRLVAAAGNECHSGRPGDP